MAGEPPYRASRRTKIAMVAGLLAFLVLLACPVAGYLVIRHELGERQAQSEADRARAEAVVEQRVRDFAEVVIRQADPDLDDDRLAELPPDPQVTVREVRREPELLVVVRSEEPYASGWMAGKRSVQACLEIEFSGLGSPAAGYELREVARCPAVHRPPRSSPPAGD